MIKALCHKLFIMGVICSISDLNRSYALEGDQAPKEQEQERQGHSIQGLILPFVHINSAHLAYEHKVSPTWGVRVDGGLMYSAGGSYALVGAVSASWLTLERKTDTASHALEWNAGLGMLFIGEVGCDPDDEAYDFVDHCSLSGMSVLRGFVGYRYQRFSGFQVRAGVAPLVNTQLSLVLPVPEVTLGMSF